MILAVIVSWDFRFESSFLADLYTTCIHMVMLFDAQLVAANLLRCRLVRILREIQKWTKQNG